MTEKERKKINIIIKILVYNTHPNINKRESGGSKEWDRQNVWKKRKRRREGIEREKKEKHHYKDIGLQYTSKHR